MSAYKGRDVVLKIGNGGLPVENFHVIGGLRVTRLLAERDASDASSIASGPWRALHEVGGLRRVSIQGEGIVRDSTGEALLRAQAIGGNAVNCQLHFGNGEQLSGAFIVTRYESIGDVREAEQFSVTLESAGTVVAI